MCITFLQGRKHLQSTYLLKMASNLFLNPNISLKENDKRDVRFETCNTGNNF